MDDIEEKIRRIKENLESSITVHINKLEIEYINPTEDIIIDGIQGFKLFDNISLFGSNPKNILFLNDSHDFKYTYRNVYTFRCYIYNNTKKEINKLDTSNEDKIKYIRELINFINDKLYKEITQDLFLKKIISVDELLYYLATNVNECYDIFIENDILNLKSNIQYSSFLSLCDYIFLNCGDKLIYDENKLDIIKDINITNIEENNAQRLCNFNCRYHRSDIRTRILGDNLIKIYYTNISDDSIYVDDSTFYQTIHLYLEYLFKENDDEIQKKKFFDKNLEHINSKSKLNYDIDMLFTFYEKSKKDIIKQYNKSIFKTKITIEKLKEIIKSITLLERFKDELPFSFQNKFYDFLNIELTSLTMNLYSLFRLFINDWHIDSKKKTRLNLSDSCNNLNYPKYIIYFAGNYHNNWLSNFINKSLSMVNMFGTIDLYIHDMSYMSHDITYSLTNDQLNFIPLSQEKYIMLKENLTLIKTTQEYLNLYNSSSSTLHIDYKTIQEFYNLNNICIKLINKYIEYKIFNSVDLLNKFEIDFVLLLDINNKINSFKILNEFEIEKLNEYLIYIKKIENIFIINKENNKNINNEINKIINNFINKLTININNIKIINNFIINNEINEINEINDINYFVNKDIINYDELLSFYNIINVNLNVCLSSPKNIINNLYIHDFILIKDLDDNIIFNLKFFLEDLCDFILNKEENQDLELDLILDIDDIFINLYKLIRNISILDINKFNIYINKFNILYYYYQNLAILINNIILVLCYEYEDNILYCTKDNIDRSTIYNYFKFNIKSSDDIYTYFKTEYNSLNEQFDRDILYYEDIIEKYKLSSDLSSDKSDDLLSDNLLIDEYLTKLNGYINNIYILFNDKSEIEIKINNIILILCYIYDDLSSDKSLNKSDPLHFDLITSKCNRSDTITIIPFDTLYKYYKDNEDISILYKIDLN